jgi:hypothetical protein
MKSLTESRVQATPSEGRITPVYATKLGELFCGKAEDLIAALQLGQRGRRKVQMVFTSPPFPLNRKKKYGNLDGVAYVEWLASFAVPLTNLLTANGSIVIELGNAWESGKPVMSTLPLKALLAFQEASGLYLCQEFICFNPARLPSPAQWVTVERCRVKDAYTRVWWLSPTPKPKADNRRILTAYSDSMRDLLRRGTYNPGRRPSEHHIGISSFLKNNSGAIPPNVLVPGLADWLTEVLPISNTSTRDAYQEYCRSNKIVPHPARMPSKLVEFFVDFLTEQGDLILDPFAGSNTTGMVAERRKRRWIGIEASQDYARASAARFDSINVEPVALTSSRRTRALLPVSQ